MGADISRVRFDSLDDFAGVVLQQGRLLLDADFNEYVALLDRRLRAETCDLTSFGPDPDHAGVAWVPRETPDAFRVTAAGGELMIGRGRMYVDGLVAENHGLEPYVLDPLLSDRVGTNDLPYTQQPYWPQPDALPTGGPHLAYLDVWEREVTYLEDPDLVEVAVGVDTTARVQTAWQVRLLQNTGDATCDSDDDEIAGWPGTITPSAGRLTTGTVDVPDEDNPCLLPPQAGYRGLENQTFRVEIHEGGAPGGTATFKWSRDNGSVAIPIVEVVSGTVLRLASLGRDDNLRISTGQWVEILDDQVELGGGLGEIRKVTVDDDAKTIEFTGAIPAELQTDFEARHLRVRRWDQSGIVRDAGGNQLIDLDASAAGVIPVPGSNATQVVLEDGVVVSFSLEPGGSGEFRRGDYWIFAARPANTSVEELDSAPPLGVHHHYARLGFVTFPSSQTSCRRLWPPIAEGGEGCECTICLTPDSPGGLQAAVDQVKATGGTICLAAGVYDLGDGVDVSGARSLRIRGQGPATMLVGRGTTLTIQQSLAVTLENLAIVSGNAAPAAVLVRSVALCSLQDLLVFSYPSREGSGAAVRLSGLALLVALRRNILVGSNGIDAGIGDDVGAFAAGLRIEDNVVVALQRGIDLGGRSAYLYSCRVERNEVLANTSGGIVATGAVAPGGSLDIVDNKIATGGEGIVVGPDATVDSNSITKLRNAPGTDGIVVAPGSFHVAPGHVRITGNRIHDRANNGIALLTRVRTFMVKENVLADVGAGIVVEGKGAAERIAVDNNELFDIATTEGAGAAFGVLLLGAGSVDVARNAIARVGLGHTGAHLAAIAVLAVDEVDITGNVVDQIGSSDFFHGTAAGVAVSGPMNAASISENSSRFSPDQAAPGQGSWQALVVQSAAQPFHVGAGKAIVPLAKAAVVLTNGWAYEAAARPDHVGVALNELAGGGEQPTCVVRVRGDVVAQGNQCSHEGGEPVGMLLQAPVITASSNRVRGPGAMLILEVAADKFAAVGNLTPGGTRLGSPTGSLPAPWQALNPIVP